MKALVNNPVTRYFREAYEELKKVTWPSREEVIRYALAVVVMCVVVGVYFGLVDWLLSQGLAALVGLTS